MIYIDCSEYLKNNNLTHDGLFRRGLEVGVDWQDGEAFLIPNTIRMNLALPRSRLEEASERLRKYVFV